jgi:branched-chain amino acid transport system ATP-binding protein
VSDVLRLHGLRAGYAGTAVVRDLDLHVEAGEVVALLGPNGAGKTTTLLTISGLLPALGGRVDVLGARLPSRWTRPQALSRRGLAHVPEDRSLFTQLTVTENLRLARGPGGTDAKVARAVEWFPELDALLDRQAGLLSGGEQQMLALARALVAEPKLLMVDELSLGLAPVVVQRLLPVVRTAADELGAGVLLVEQHVHLALEVADQAYLLDHGDLVVEGDAATLAERPDLLASSYLGTRALAD